MLNLIRDTRGGMLNEARFHHRFSGHGAYADLLGRRFARAMRQWGFEEGDGLVTTQFAPPAPAAAAAEPQLSLF